MRWLSREEGKADGGCAFVALIITVLVVIVFAGGSSLFSSSNDECGMRDGLCVGETENRNGVIVTRISDDLTRYVDTVAGIVCVYEASYAMIGSNYSMNLVGCDPIADGYSTPVPTREE